MRADEMLKELGYEVATEKYAVEEDCIIYKNKSGNSLYFSLKEKAVAAYTEEMKYMSNKMALLEMVELVAITEKCRELGWL